MLLDPCRDNIYSGTSPHVKCLGREGQYQLAGNTEKGKKYIDLLQLNAGFYRKMREKQEQADRDDHELDKLVDEISKESDVPAKLLQSLKELIGRNYLIQVNHQQDPVFRCGHSKAGQAFQEVLDILDSQSVTYELLFAEKDLDIKIQYDGKTYLCEIVLNDSVKEQVKNIRVKTAKRESWLAEGGEHGILYYYLAIGRLEFYKIDRDNELLVCLKESN